MVTTRIPKQKLPSLFGIDTLLRSYATSRSARDMRQALHDFIQIEGYDKLKTFLTAALAAVPTLNPALLQTDGTLSRQIPQLGVPVIAVHSQWDGIPFPAFTYQWKRGGSAISGATAAAYTPVFADVGTLLSCTITGTNTGGNTSETLSAASNTVDDAAFPHNTAVPTITGTGTVGQTLTGANGTWTPSTGLTFTLGWYRDGVAIAGATAATYLLVSADSTHQITFKVTGTNAKGQALQATSVNKAVS